MRRYQRVVLALLGSAVSLGVLAALWQAWQSPALMLRIMQLPTLCGF